MRPASQAVSTARTSRPTFVSEPWGGIPATPNAEPVREPAAPHIDPAPLHAEPVAPYVDPAPRHAGPGEPVREPAAPHAEKPWQPWQPSPEDVWQARAVETQAKAVALARQAGDSRVVKDFSARLELFRAGQPCTNPE